MMNVMYCHVPKITKEVVDDFLSILTKNGITISHLGKNDPPRKWSADVCAASETILSGEELTIYTFFRDKKAKIDGTIEIHRDPRWNHDTVSISGTDHWVLQKIGTSLHSELKAYLTIIGVIGLGKDQAWTALGIRPDCPAEMLSKIRLTTQANTENIQDADLHN